VFTAAATGSPLQYYWLKDGTVVAEGTNATYELQTVSRYDAGTYTFMAGNGLGTVSSTGAVLTVYHLPEITNHPWNQSVMAGADAQFSVIAIGGLLQYQWFKEDPTNTAAATAIVTNGFLVGAEVAAGGSGYLAAPQVRIVGGPGYAATATALMSNDVVVAIRIDDPGWGYTSAPQIEIDPPSILLKDQTNAVLNLSATVPGDAGRFFVEVSNPAGTVTSESANLVVNLGVHFVDQPQSQTVPATSNATFSVTVSGDPPIGYQWYYAPPTLAKAGALVWNGFVYAAELADGGAGYTSPPEVRFVGGGGQGAAALATVSNGVVTAITVTSAGAGYTNAPDVEIDPPAYVLLDGQTNATFTIQSAQIGDSGGYLVFAANNFGAVRSDIATLVVTPNSNTLVNPSGPPLSFTQTGSGLQLQFTGDPGQPYVLQTTADLTPPILWESVSTNNASAEGLWQYTDPNLDATRKFYRVMKY